MLRYLSDAWLDAAAERLSAVRLDPPLPSPGLVVVTRVTDVPGRPGETVDYSFTFSDDRVHLAVGTPTDDGAPAVRFTQRFRTAESVARGTLSAQSAFMSGDIRLGGDVSALTANAGLVAQIGDELTALRVDTEFSKPEPI